MDLPLNAKRVKFLLYLNYRSVSFDKAWEKTETLAIKKYSHFKSIKQVQSYLRLNDTVHK